MNSPQKTPGRLSALALAAAAIGCLALAPGRLTAADGFPMSTGGGDAIGSLPFTVPPPEYLLTPPRPSIVLEAPSLAAIESVVLDAWGDGYAEFLEGEAGVRIELQGRVQLLLDRQRLEAGVVRLAFDVSQGFSSGLGVLSKGPQVLGTQLLPAEGDLALPLEGLLAGGLLDESMLNLHCYSLGRRHHELELSASGNTVRLSSHE